MSFYLNDFKRHLKALHDKVDHPYDTPLGRDMNTSKNTTSLSEAYGNMKTSRTGNFQRPAPSQLNEAARPYQSLKPKWHQMKGTEVDITGQPIKPYTPVTPTVKPDVTPDGTVVPIPGTNPQLYTNGIAVFDALGKEIMQ